MVEETTSAATRDQKNSKEYTECITTDLPVNGLVDEFDSKHGIVDSTTPRETHLSGRFKRSFAYYTFRQRLPNTLNALLTTLSKNVIGTTTTDENDVAIVLNSIEVLKKQLENDGPLETLTGNEPDKGLWNDFLASLPQHERFFFQTCWLYAECYLYRKIFAIFQTSNSLRNYDYFGAQKLNGLKISIDVMDQIISNVKITNKNEETFTHILKLNLWGNRCDLSISSGQEVKPQDALFDCIDNLNANILIDHSTHIWHCLNQPSQLNGLNCKVVDIVCDNAGFELFTDLLLARFLKEHGLADVVRFHVKAMPWYVSDTTAEDIECLLRYLKAHTSENLIEFGKQCCEYFEKSSFQVAEKDFFWTSPYEYYRMPDINPSLYQLLQNSTLIIFKGDLNYRKLLGDFNWDTTDCFEKCLRGFKPSHLCSLRTVKGDLICGLEPGLADRLSSQNSDWMFTGEYGIVHFSKC